jgi:hypothetical protein
MKELNRALEIEPQNQYIINEIKRVQFEINLNSKREVNTYSKMINS